jgi:hypothetical protein
MAFQSKGLYGYNRVSQSQLQVALKFVPDIVSSLNSVESLSPELIRIVDYGCSEGRNSMITFAEVFKLFRESHSIPISILHTDLPENNWQAVNNAINQGEETYLQYQNIFYSTLGRSFFNQVVPEGSVHLGFTSYALHYLSEKQPREPGEFGWVFENGRKQGFKDLTNLLKIRINELAIGGVFVMIINARENLNQDPSLGRYSFESIKRLLDRNIITENEFKHYVWHSYPYHIQEIHQLLEKFSDQIEIIKAEYGKIPFPYYSDFLLDQDKEKFKTSMNDMLRVMMKNPLFTALDRDEEKKEDIMEIALKEVGSMIDEQIFELHQDYICVIFKRTH